MDTLPYSLKKLIEFFEKFPSVGPKTAKRLGFFLLKLPQSDLDEAASHLTSLKNNSKLCMNCCNLTDKGTLCTICTDVKRNKGLIVVVEDVLDLLSMEVGRKYEGVYHVLHGKIDPLHYVGPDDLYIEPLVKRVEAMNGDLHEIVLATNPTMEGEATALYVKKRLEEIKDKKMKITRLAYGLPIGADLEYADYMTLEKAMEGRREY